MDKLVTDKPKDNFSFVLNYVFSRDGQAYIRTDEDGNGVLLTQWMKAQCIAHGCTELEDVNVEDIDEIISDCAFDFDICPLFVLYKCACQAVHLRDRLKAYEDTGFMPDQLRNFQKEAPRALTQEDLNRMHFDKVWLSCGSDPDHGEDGEWAVVIYGQIYSIETLDGSGFEDLLQDSLYGETLDNPSGQYKVTQTVTITDSSTPDANMEDAIAMVQGSEFDVTGAAFSPAFRSSLAAMKTADGRKLYPELAWGSNPGSINGLRVESNSTISANSSLDRALVGDFESCFKWGYAKQIPVEIIRYGNPDNDATLGDLKGHNQIYLRAEAYIGWGILSPAAFAWVKAGAGA